MLAKYLNHPICAPMSIHSKKHKVFGMAEKKMIRICWGPAVPSLSEANLRITFLTLASDDLALHIVSTISRMK